jgi:hypothetical protein
VYTWLVYIYINVWSWPGGESSEEGGAGLRHYRRWGRCRRCRLSLSPPPPSPPLTAAASISTRPASPPSPQRCHRHWGRPSLPPIATAHAASVAAASIDRLHRPPPSPPLASPPLPKEGAARERERDRSRLNGYKVRVRVRVRERVATSQSGGPWRNRTSTALRPYASGTAAPSGTRNKVQCAVCCVQTRAINGYGHRGQRKEEAARASTRLAAVLHAENAAVRPAAGRVHRLLLVATTLHALGRSANILAASILHVGTILRWQVLLALYRDASPIPHFIARVHLDARSLALRAVAVSKLGRLALALHGRVHPRPSSEGLAGQMRPNSVSSKRPQNANIFQERHVGHCKVVLFRRAAFHFGVPFGTPKSMICGSKIDSGSGLHRV